MSQQPIQLALPGFEAARAQWQDEYGQQLGEDQTRRKRSDSRREGGHLISVIGGGEQVNIAVCIEVAVPIVHVIAGDVIFVRQIVARKDR